MLANFELKLTSRRIPRPELKLLAYRETHGVTQLAARSCRGSSLVGGKRRAARPHAAVCGSQLSS
jgi:hypothetical protein